MATPTNILMTGSVQFCWICGHAVDLNTCKTDEYGKAVHEPCYAAKIKLNGAPKLATVCPQCDAEIEPLERKRVNFHEIKCPWCDAIFQPGKTKLPPA